MEKNEMMKGAEKQLSLYVAHNIVSDFDAIPPAVKLTIVNAAAKKAIKYREVGGKRTPYLDHFFSKKAANFLFNFDVGVDILATEMSTSKTGTGKDLYECSRDVRFSFPSRTGGTTARTVTGTAKAYENPAISRYDVKKMALSNAWTLFLQSFGVSPRELDTGDVYHADEPTVPAAPAINKLTY